MSSDTTEEQQEALKAQKSALEGLVVNNADLETLEIGLADFNIFEAIGMVRQEIRHSAFLAFLLNPSGNHGLGDWFLKSFLKKAVAAASGRKELVSPIDIDIADLSQCDDTPQWNNKDKGWQSIDKTRRYIDILVHDKKKKIVAAIENKVFASESDGQLEDYRDIVENGFKGYQYIFIFLTPDGRLPKKDEDKKFWISVGYDLVLELLDQVVNRKSRLSEAVSVTIGHYITMVRRHIMTDDDIVELCLKINREHRVAMDLILEHRPDRQSKLQDILTELVKKEEEKILSLHSSKSFIRFIPKKLQEHFKTDSIGKDKYRGLWFSFDNGKNVLSLKLRLRTRDSALHKAIIEHASNSMSGPFEKFKKTKPDAVTVTLSHVPILSTKDLEELEENEFEESAKSKITDNWDKFREETMDKLVGALLELPPVTSAPEGTP